MDITTSITNNISFVSSIDVYPNPTDRMITIQLKAQKTSNFNISLWSNDGRLIYSNIIQNTHQFQEVIDLSQVAKGLYLLKIESEGQQAISKLLKQ